MPNLFKTTRFWIILILLVLLVSAGVSYWLSQIQQEARIAVLYQNGTVIRTIDLNQITAEETFAIIGEDGCSNTIALAPGQIRIQEASCPDHVCVQQGWIDDSVYPIVCLPNRLVIRIEAPEESRTSNGIDIMTQ